MEPDSEYLKLVVPIIHKVFSHGYIGATATDRKETSGLNLSALSRTLSDYSDLYNDLKRMGSLNSKSKEEDQNDVNKLRLP